MSRRFGRPYAQALLQTAGDDDAAKTVRADLGEFAEAAQKVPGIHTMAASPAIPIEVKESVLGEICEKLEIGTLATTFLHLLMKNYRLIRLGEILEAVDQILNRRFGVVVAEVVSAQALDEGRQHRLEEVLGRLLDQQVDLTTKTDPKLLGGFVARIGSYRYDASLNGQLSRLASSLAQHG